MLFFVLTYAVTWVCWMPVVHAAGAPGASLRALWLLGVFGPAIVAVGLTAREEGLGGVRSLLTRVVRWHVAARWYVFAAGYMIAIKLAVAVVYRLTTRSWPHFGSEGPIVMLLATIVSTPFQAGEEIGWRGYALPRLADRMGLARASVLLGVLWAGWHLPQFFVAAADTYHQSFPLWTVQVTALSVAIAWLYARTNGSLLLTMLMHAAVNNTKDIVPSVAVGASNPFALHASAVLYLSTGLMWAVAAYFLTRMPATVNRASVTGGMSVSGDASADGSARGAVFRR